MKQFGNKIIAVILIIGVSIGLFIISKNFNDKYQASKITNDMEKNQVEVVLLKEDETILEKKMSYTKSDSIIDLLERNFNPLSFKDKTKNQIVEIDSLKQDESHLILIYVNDNQYDGLLSDIEVNSNLKLKIVEVSIS